MCPTIHLDRVSSATGDLPSGVLIRDLQMHADNRGVFTEIFREEWETGVSPLQWNFVSSHAGTLRGMHVHPIHDDYLVVLSGQATIALRDLRKGSATPGAVALVTVDGDVDHCAIVIPHGIAHGFLFHSPSVYVNGVSHYWDTDDELAFRWDDPESGISWPISHAPIVSERDQQAATLGEVLAALEAWQPF